MARRNHAPGPDDCTGCRLFVDDPQQLERELTGLCILSSGQGSTRGRSGICLARDTFQDPEPACDAFQRRLSGLRADAKGVTSP